MPRAQIIIWVFILLLSGCAAEKRVERVPLPTETAETYFNRGVDASQKGDFKRAVSYYNKAIDVNPEFIVAYLNRGFVNELLGKLENACADWNMAFSLGQKEAEKYIKECK
mgnify:CR=1 FL=1